VCSGQHEGGETAIIQVGQCDHGNDGSDE
jgi:hypothetical protein